MCFMYLIECALQNLGEGNIISVKIKPITSITSVVAIAEMRLPAPETEDLVLFWGKVLKYLFLRPRAVGGGVIREVRGGEYPRVRE